MTSAKARTVDGAIVAAASHPQMIRFALHVDCEAPAGKAPQFVEIVSKTISTAKSTDDVGLEDHSESLTHFDRRHCAREER